MTRIALGSLAVFFALIFNASARLNGSCSVGGVYSLDCTQRCCASGRPYVDFDDRCSCDANSDCSFLTNGACCNGRCINTLTHACCKSEHPDEVYDLYNEKCCPRDGVVSWSQKCTCSSSSQCPGFHGRGETSCCTRQKFPNEGSGVVINGTCHNPSVDQCCQTSIDPSGMNVLIEIKEDKDEQNVCCKNIGIIPTGAWNSRRCPCSQSSDCPGSSETCCFDSDASRNYWRKTHSAIAGLPAAPWGSFDEYGDNNNKCSRDCRTGGADNGGGLGSIPFCRGQCVSAAAGDTCCADGIIADDNKKCCQVKPSFRESFNALTFSSSFNLFVSYDAVTQYCCPRGSANSNSYTIPIPLHCQGNPMTNQDRCACQTDADCQTGGTCCGGQCTIAAAKEKCCEGFSDKQEPVIIREDQTCCPLVPAGVNNGQLCPCAADKHCPSGRSCCNGGNCFSSAERCDNQVLKDNAGLYMIHCQGVCINTEHDKCCGTDITNSNTPVVCKSKHQKCCGENTNMAACCYKHTEVCHKTKPLEGDPKYLCSVSLQPSHSIIFHAIVFPIILTFVLIAIYIVAVLHAVRHSSTNRMLTMATVGIGVLVMLMGLLLLWSMLWKFSVVAIVGNAAILSALGAHSHWHRRVAGALALIALLYVVDPFTGNSLLSFHWSGPGDVTQNGLQDAAKAKWEWGWNSYSDVNPSRCAAYYQWFYLNEADWDVIASENQYNNKYDVHRRYWGICTLGWVHAINIIAGLAVIFQILLSSMGLFLLARHGVNDVEK